MSVNAGNYAGSPFQGSVIKQKGRPKQEEEETSDEDTSIDYIPELDEPLHGGVSDDTIPDETWPDFPDDMSSVM